MEHTHTLYIIFVLVPLVITVWTQEQTERHKGTTQTHGKGKLTPLPPPTPQSVTVRNELLADPRRHNVPVSGSNGVEVSGEEMRVLRCGGSGSSLHTPVGSLLTILLSRWGQSRRCFHSASCLMLPRLSLSFSLCSARPPSSFYRRLPSKFSSLGCLSRFGFTQPPTVGVPLVTADSLCQLPMVVPNTSVKLC